VKSSIPAVAALTAAVVTAALAACAAPWAPFGAARAQRIALVLPALPDSWSCLANDLFFELSWVDADGRRRGATGSPGASIDVELGRGEAQAIVAWPKSEGRCLEPAGALYPSALTASAGGDALSLIAFLGGEEKLELDWPGGYAAQVALLLEAAGLDPRRFDLARLRNEAAARSADPWASLAPAEAARRLATGSFRADALGEPKRWSVVLPGPDPWAPESPLAVPPAMAVAEDGTAAWSTSAPEGISRFIGEDCELFVSVDEEGGSSYVRLPSPGVP